MQSGSYWRAAVRLHNTVFDVSKSTSGALLSTSDPLVVSDHARQLISSKGQLSRCICCVALKDALGPRVHAASDFSQRRQVHLPTKSLLNSVLQLLATMCKALALNVPNDLQILNSERLRFFVISDILLRRIVHAHSRSLKGTSWGT